LQKSLNLLGLTAILQKAQIVKLPLQKATNENIKTSVNSDGKPFFREYRGFYILGQKAD